MGNNIEYIRHYQKVMQIYPSVFALKFFIGNNPQFSFRNIDIIEKKILDLGFGDGRDLLFLHSLGLKVYGIEVDQDIIDKVKKLINNSSIILEKGSNNHTNFKDSFFDIVYAISTIMYLEDNTKTIYDSLYEVHRILKPNGYFCGTLAHAKTHVVKDGVFLDKNHLILKDPYYGLRDGQHYHVYNSKEEIKHDFNKVGFKIEILTNYDADWFGSRERLFLFVARKK